MGSNSLALLEKPHAVCTPFPTQGHINPMLKLAKFLHYKGFHITFVNTEFNHKRLLRSQGPNSLDGLPTFQFEAIPDGLPPSDANVAQDLTSLSQSISKNCLAPFKGLLSKLNSSSNCPPVTWIVSDSIMTFTLYAAQELGVPSVLLGTTSACALMGLLQIPPLIEKGLLKDPSFLTNGYLDTVIDWIPGMENIRLKDIPFFPTTTDQNDITLDYFLNEIKQGRMASATIFNTFDALEHEVVDALSSSLTHVYCIGPLQLHLNQIPPDYIHLNSIKSNLWAEETECLEWLDSKEPNSVVYVNFGSHTVMTNEQLIEFAWGLANSNKTFLWVIRPDLVEGESVVVPAEFVEETKQRSLLASWCPQELVLSHPAVGVFLTHSGWNSTLETICGGVPVICWPFFSDQQMNCRLCCKEWGIGMEIEGEVKRNYVEGVVPRTAPK